jgi:hypothetical protein
MEVWREYYNLDRNSGGEHLEVTVDGVRLG